MSEASLTRADHRIFSECKGTRVELIFTVREGRGKIEREKERDSARTSGYV